MSRPKFRPKVYVLEKDNSFVTKVSTTTNDEFPSVVFLRAKIRITPCLEKKTYEKEILSLKNVFETFARKTLDNMTDYDKNYIFTFDVAEKSVRFKKTSHLRYDIYLKPKINNTLLEHKNKLKTISDKLDEMLILLFKKNNLKWF